MHLRLGVAAGRLRDDVDLFRRLLRPAFPGGTLPGSPKWRAMEIIERLDPPAAASRRGAIGISISRGS